MIPEGKRIPFGSTAFPVTTGGTVLQLTPSDEPAHLRLTVALDQRAEYAVDVLDGDTVLGQLDLRYGYACQTFGLTLDRIPAQLGLRLAAGDAPVWLFATSPEDALSPHVAHRGGNPLDRFHQKLDSLASVQPFGWLEGCVLDALHDLDYTPTLEKHLALFFNSHRRLIYEDPRSSPRDDDFHGIEALLPLAVIAERWPDHLLIDKMLDFCQSRTDANDVILDGGTVTAEGSYTIAYPLAVIARQRGRDDLARWSLRQLVVRRDHLVVDDNLHLRHHTDDSRTFRNWARAYSWYMLGLARVLPLVPDAALEDEFRRIAGIAMRYQRDDGLWSVFLDEPHLKPDTSGAAGIATALARGAAANLLDISARSAAERTLAGLQPYLTIDGYLTGVAQSNKGGEALQRSDYRVISQMGMGLMGQLIAALAPA
jgi:unsaturated rhamnogalacturonyl hydrolase